MRTVPLPASPGLGEVGRAHGSWGFGAFGGSSVKLQSLPIVLVWLSRLGAPAGRRYGVVESAQTLEALARGTSWASLEKDLTYLNLRFPAGGKWDVVVRFNHLSA